MSETQEKTVVINDSNFSNYTVGQHVNVLLNTNKGFEALMWGYLIPFVILFITLLISSSYMSELYSGIVAILILIPYYIMLYFVNGRMKRKFNFQIEPL